MAGGYPRKKMMLNMQEHVEGEPIFDAVMQCSRQMVRSIAVVVDCPNREEGCHALTCEHRTYVILQNPAVQESEDHYDPYQAQSEFPEHGHPQLSIAIPECSDV